MKLAIYDFDGTYMKNEVLRKVFKFWKIKGLNRRMYRKVWYTILFRNLLHRLNLFGWTKAKFRVNAMSLTADLFRSITKEELDLFLNDLYHYLQQYINPTLRTQLRSDKEAGFHTILLSGNFDVILSPFKQEGFDQVIGTPVLKNGEIIPSSEVKIIIHDLKAKTIRLKYPQADFQKSKAYADSYYDLPILELVGNPIAFNPDEGLKKIATDRKYTVLETTI